MNIIVEDYIQDMPAITRSQTKSVKESNSVKSELVRFNAYVDKMMIESDRLKILECKCNYRKLKLFKQMYYDNLRVTTELYYNIGESIEVLKANVKRCQNMINSFYNRQVALRKYLDQKDTWLLLNITPEEQHIRTTFLNQLEETGAKLLPYVNKISEIPDKLKKVIHLDKVNRYPKGSLSDLEYEKQCAKQEMAQRKVFYTPGKLENRYVFTYCNYVL